MAEVTDKSINRVKDLHTPVFMKVIDTLIGDNYNYFTSATFDVEPENSHRKVQISIKSIPMNRQDARSAVADIQDALLRDHKMNSITSGKGKTLDVPIPTSGKKDQVIRIAIRQPSVSGSGGGSEVTRVGESAQCYYLALRFYHREHSKHDLSCGCDTVLQKEDFEWAVSNGYVDTNATVDEVVSLPLDWRESCCNGANALYSELNGGSGHKYKFVRGNNTNDIDDGAIKKAFLKVKKLHADQGGTDFSSEDKWNPADIWIVDKGEENSIKTQLSNITSLGDLNTLVYNLYKSADLIGVSLKKNPNKPGIKLKNKPGVTRTTEANWVKSEVVFDNKKNFTGKNISKRYPMDVYIYYGNGANDRFQARNFGGSSTSPTASWQLELKGKFANQGRIGGGVVYGVMSRMKPAIKPSGKLAYSKSTNQTTWADAKGNKLVDEIYDRLKDNKAKGLNGLSEADIKGRIMEQDQSYRYSKISGLRLIDFLKNHTRKTKVVEALFNYASSESDDLGVYLKMQ